MSATLEAEMEQEITQTQAKCVKLSAENSELSEQLEDMKCQEMQDVCHKLTCLQDSSQRNNAHLSSKIRTLETVYDTAVLKLREKDAEIEHLQVVHSSTLEHLGIMSSELDAVQSASQETTQRLKMEIQDLTHDLQVVKKTETLGLTCGQPEPNDGDEIKLQLNLSLEGKNQISMIDDLIATLNSNIETLNKTVKRKKAA